jgi:hypothetical protein
MNTPRALIYWGLAVLAVLAAMLVLGVLAARQRFAHSAQSATATPWSGAHMSTPEPFPHDIHTPFPATLIANARIDAHIPRGINPADRKIIREVMAMLPPTKRAHIEWFRLPPGKPGYEELPNRGLVVLYGQYVLYFDGRVQPDSNVIYIRGLDRYLTVVPEGLKYNFQVNPSF